MEKITGRSDDMMIVRGVNVFPTQVEELVLAESALAPYFQCVLTRPGRLDELTVLVESHETLVEADKAAVTERLVARIKDRIGTTARVEVRDPGGIERSVGKARRVVDERPTFPHTSR
jgi:phenylacetate-CoA ligase